MKTPTHTSTPPLTPTHTHTHANIMQTELSHTPRQTLCACMHTRDAFTSLQQATHTNTHYLYVCMCVYVSVYTMAERNWINMAMLVTRTPDIASPGTARGGVYFPFTRTQNVLMIFYTFHQTCQKSAPERKHRRHTHTR